MSSSSRKPSRRSGGGQPKAKPYKFKARPAPKNNVKSSFSRLKQIVDTPVSAGLTQVESGFRAAIFDTLGGNIGRVVVQVDATLHTVRQLVKMFVLKDKRVPAYVFLDRNREGVPRPGERDVLACDALHAPKAEHTLPVILISYGGEGDVAPAPAPAAATSGGGGGERDADEADGGGDGAGVEGGSDNGALFPSAAP